MTNMVILSDLLRPQVLDVSIRGHPEPWFRVVYDSQQILYSHSESWDAVPKGIGAPSDRQWLTFLSKLHELKVWRLRSTYERHDIIDGTRWANHLAYDEYEIASFGSNGFPRTYDKFITAVRELIGGRELY